MAIGRQKKVGCWTWSALLLGGVLFLAGFCIGFAGIAGFISEPKTQDIGSFALGMSFISLLPIVIGLGLLGLGIRALRNTRNIEAAPAQSVRESATQTTSASPVSIKSEPVKSTSSGIYCISCRQFIGYTTHKVSCFPDNREAYLCSYCADRYSHSFSDQVFVQMESLSDCRKVLLGLQVHSNPSDSAIDVDQRLSVDKMAEKLNRFWVNRPSGFSQRQGSSYYWSARGERQPNEFTRIIQHRDRSQGWENFYVRRLSDTEYIANALRFFGVNDEGERFEV